MKGTNDGHTPVILDCTVRDGSYAIDFKFTEADTRLLVGELARLGFRWIEVGHGLGLGAAEAGKGDLPASDVELIRAAKSAAGDAMIGVFFIPGIGRTEHLEAARDAGLDFVRIGENAPDVERTHPYLVKARQLGLIPCVNMMKSYGVTPEDFGEKSKGVVGAGAQIVYCVDSAGSMLPDDVVRYFDAARKAVDCELGFHGHNNLMMVIANCIAAYEHGVRYLDASLCGLGRSAGNAPTEILVAAFERMGISTNVDLFALMDTIEKYMWPLVAHTRSNDMMGVTAGYSQFHSSFLPKVAAVADRHGVELRRLVAKAAQHNPVELDEDYVERAARELAGTVPGCSSEALVAFQASRISRQRISSTMESVDALLKGMIVSKAKRESACPVLHLVPSESEVGELVLPEFAIEDAQMVMGRVTFGSFEVLRRVVELARPHVSLFLVNQWDGWAAGAYDRVAEIVGPEKTVSIDDNELRRALLRDALDRAGRLLGRGTLLVYSPDAVILEALQSGSCFETVFVYGADEPISATVPHAVTLRSGEDWRELNLRFDVVLCGDHPTESDARMLVSALAPNGRIMFIQPAPAAILEQTAGDRLIRQDMNLAYGGVVGRFLATADTFTLVEARKAVLV